MDRQIWQENTINWQLTKALSHTDVISGGKCEGFVHVWSGGGEGDWKERHRRFTIYRSTRTQDHGLIKLIPWVERDSLI